MSLWPGRCPLAPAYHPTPPRGRNTAFQHHPCIVTQWPFLLGTSMYHHHAPTFLLSFPPPLCDSLRLRTLSVKNIIYVKKPVATATQRSSCYLVCSLQLGPQKVFMEGGVQPAGPCFSFIACHSCRCRSWERGHTCPEWAVHKAT